MANSATSAAKRRRAGIATPITNGGNMPSNLPPAPQSGLMQNNKNAQSQPLPTNPLVNGENMHRLNLQQVISLLDNRLLNVEKFVCDFDKMTLPNSQLPSKDVPQTNNADLKTNINEATVVSNTISSEMAKNIEIIIQDALNTHVDEFNHRYEILASEILSLKNIILKLQSYTMDVNKVLMDERVRVLSDINISGNINNVEESIDSNIEINNEEKIGYTINETTDKIETIETETVETETVEAEPVNAPFDIESILNSAKQLNSEEINQTME